MSDRITKNYAFTTGRSLPDVENGFVFDRYNFVQMLPHTPIFTSKTGLRFTNCNLMNCDLPADAVVEGSLQCHVSFCSHEHPGWIEKGLPVCIEQCQHLVDTDVVSLNSIVIDTIRHYKDQGVA